MSSVLIGHTGFVGGNLIRSRPFDECFHSKTIGDLAGRTVDELWCAGVQAVKWWANANPDEDWAGIERLLTVLHTVQAKRFILISTVDVYQSPVGVDETTPVEEQGLHPYGLHRRRVERMVEERFSDHLIVRLPGLYGPGLKKNVIYDLMHGRPVDGFHADARFQFYNLDRLAADVEVALTAGLKLVHLATEPVSVAEIARAAFDQDFTNRPAGTPPNYDFRTAEARHWGGDGAYILTRDAVLDDIRRFVAAETAAFR